jgi:hypothetical protein
MKSLLLAALLPWLAASAAVTDTETHHIVLASGTGANNVLLNHLIDTTRKRVTNAFPATVLADFKETTVVFQDKPVVQVIFFKSATENGFLFEYRIENGKATLLKEQEGVIADPEAPSAAPLKTGAANGPVEVKLADAPEPVRRSINTELSNGPLKSIEKVPHNRRMIYKVSLQQKDGTEKVVYLNADGTYVKD